MTCCTYCGSTQRAVYTVQEIQIILGIGKNQAYQLARSGAFPVRQVGSKIVISRAGFNEWLNGCEKDSDANDKKAS